MSTVSTVPQPRTRLLSVDRVAELCDVSRATIYRWRDAGRMPRPAKIGNKAVRWRQDVLEQWIADGCPPQSRS